MIVYLMRHGTAVDRESLGGRDDPSRPLTEQGELRVRQVADGLRKLGVKPGLLLTSGYVRARQTADIVCRVLGLGAGSIRETDALVPTAEPARLLAELRRAKNAETLCVGHLPHLDLALAALLGLSAPVATLKKAGVACVDWPGRGAGALLWLATPKLLRKL